MLGVNAVEHFRVRANRLKEGRSFLMNLNGIMLSVNRISSWHIESKERLRLKSVNFVTDYTICNLEVNNSMFIRYHKNLTDRRISTIF